ncbi:hypothetical protein AAU61_05540 [Desulfocarbo indianensis]|nr:hypothetical protein AAU61_05540 [Desulfocarbo indianensis]
MKNFGQKLFDFSFQEFITPSIIKIIFWIAIIFIGLGVLINIIGSFSQGAGYGILSLIISPLVGLLFVIMTRIYLELVMVLFRIMGLLEGIAKEKGVTLAAPAAAAPAVAAPAPAMPSDFTPPPPPGE